MTEEEAKKLQMGERVEVRIQNVGWRQAVVIWKCYTVLHPQRLKVQVRRKRTGERSLWYWRECQDVRHPSDPRPANVYADYLEEHGETRAAAMLREAFPLPVRQEGKT